MPQNCTINCIYKNNVAEVDYAEVDWSFAIIVYKLVYIFDVPQVGTFSDRIHFLHKEKKTGEQLSTSKLVFHFPSRLDSEAD